MEIASAALEGAESHCGSVAKTSWSSFGVLSWGPHDWPSRAICTYRQDSPALPLRATGCLAELSESPPRDSSVCFVGGLEPLLLEQRSPRCWLLGPGSSHQHPPGSPARPCSQVGSPRRGCGEHFLVGFCGVCHQTGFTGDQRAGRKVSSFFHFFLSW